MTPGFDVLLITDEGPALAARVEAALRGAAPGRVAVQLRNKSLPLRALLPIAQELRALTRRLGVPLLLNERVDLALAIEADGVHLPVRGLPAPVARALLGAGRWVGQSCHDEAELARASEEGCDYVTLAPVRSVPGKGAPLGMAELGRLCATTQLPVFALGGLSPDDVPAISAAGARGVAVIRAVLGAADPGAAMRAFCETFVK